MKLEEIRAKAQQAWVAVEQMPGDHPLHEFLIKEALEWDDLLARREQEE